MAHLIMTSTNRDTSERAVKGVLVDPSAGSWVVVITDTEGKVVFSAKGAAADAVFYPIQDTWIGINITTATNITRVIIYS